jgi:hypothetical protein
MIVNSTSIPDIEKDITFLYFVFFNELIVLFYK